MSPAENLPAMLEEIAEQIGGVAYTKDVRPDAVAILKVAARRIRSAVNAQEAEERWAWDRYVASALGVPGAGMAAVLGIDYPGAVRAADALLEARRGRFGGQPR